MAIEITPFEAIFLLMFGVLIVFLLVMYRRKTKKIDSSKKDKPDDKITNPTVTKGMISEVHSNEDKSIVEISINNSDIVLKPNQPVEIVHSAPLPTPEAPLNTPHAQGGDERLKTILDKVKLNTEPVQEETPKQTHSDKVESLENTLKKIEEEVKKIKVNTIEEKPEEPSPIEHKCANCNAILDNGKCPACDRERKNGIEEIVPGISVIKGTEESDNGN